MDIIWGSVNKTIGGLIMSSDYSMYDFLDNDKLEKYFDYLIEEKLFELKIKYK